MDAEPDVKVRKRWFRRHEDSQARAMLGSKMPSHLKGKPMYLFFSTPRMNAWPEEMYRICMQEDFTVQKNMMTQEHYATRIIVQTEFGPWTLLPPCCAFISAYSACAKSSIIILDEALTSLEHWTVVGDGVPTSQHNCP